MRYLGGLLCSVALAACGSVKGTSTDASTSDIDAPTECPIGVPAMCAGDQLVSCDSSGHITSTEQCTLGCDVANKRCKKVTPSNGLAAALDDAESAPDVMLMGNTAINTDAGTITDQSGARVLPTQTLAATPVSTFVIKVKSLTTGGNISVTGTKALAIVSAGDVSIGHVLSASATGGTSGPGAVSNENGCKGGNAGAGNAEGQAGGGGGGFGTAGGRGGNGGNPTVAGGLAGGTAGNPELTPLRGGCPGGRASNQSASWVAGGAGGAVQIVSNTSIKLTSGGAISANGGGAVGPTGPLACLVNTPCGNGEGAGAGGGILLEAPVVDVPAMTGLYTNGGGGSCAVYGSSANGTNSTAPASGQTCGGQTGNGGAGGAGATNPLNGGDITGNDAVGGGGGGGRGRIRINLPVGMTFSPAGATSGVVSIGALEVR